MVMPLEILQVMLILHKCYTTLSTYHNYSMTSELLDVEYYHQQYQGFYYSDTNPRLNCHITG